MTLDPRIGRDGPVATSEFDEPTYCVVFWSHTGPEVDDAWLSDAFYLHDVNAEDALKWAFANQEPGELVELLALVAAGDDVYCLILYGKRPTKDSRWGPFPPPTGQRLPNRAAADKAWSTPARWQSVN